MKTTRFAVSLLLSLALPAHATVDLQSMARAFPEGGLKGVDATNVQVAQAREMVAKALGDDVRDLVFVPITPCTVWDTRFASDPNSSGLIANGQTKKFYSHLDGGGGSFATWGGNPTCPETAQNSIGGRPFAVMLTVYISDATAQGWLTLYRDGDSDPSLATISVYYSPGPTRTQTVISKSSRGYGSGSYDVAATSRFASTNASAAVTGYFIKAVNIRLANSTATAGNILKGNERFIHDTGIANTFIGLNAGNFTITGSNNTACGAFSLASNTSGADNAATGFVALFNNTTGIFNAASGAYALYSNSTGGFNTASGMNALYNNTTGTGNIALGYGAGLSLTTGDSNIALGHVGVAGESSTTRIGTNQTRTFIAGIRGVTSGVNDMIAVGIDSAGQLGTTSSSRRFKDDIADMDQASAALMKLRPVTFHYKSDHDPKGRRLQYGLIAEEVTALYPGLVARSGVGEAETVLYQFLPPMLLNEYQKQQRTIDGQQHVIEQLRAEMAELRREVSLIRKGARE